MQLLPHFLPITFPVFRDLSGAAGGAEIPKPKPAPGVSGFEWSECGTEIPKRTERICGEEKPAEPSGWLHSSYWLHEHGTQGCLTVVPFEP